MRVARSIVLSEEQRARLKAYARGRSVAKRVAERASIVLQAAESKQDREIAAVLRIGRRTVARWRARFLEHGVRGIEKDATRPGRVRTIDSEEIVRKTTQDKPPNATHVLSQLCDQTNWPVTIQFLAIILVMKRLPGILLAGFLVLSGGEAQLSGATCLTIWINLLALRKSSPRRLSWPRVSELEITIQRSKALNSFCKLPATPTLS